MTSALLKSAIKSGRIADRLQVEDPTLTRVEAVRQAIKIQRGVIL